MVRVLIDATALPPFRGGVGRYVDELIAHLPQVGVDVHVVCQQRDVELYTASVGWQNIVVLPAWASSPAQRLVWEQVGLPRVIRSRRPDVVHSPHYTMPLATSGRRGPKQVVTLHDATFFSDPHLHLAVKARFFTQWTRLSARRADVLLVPSQATKDELVRVVHADADRIKVIPHGVDHRHFRRPSGDEVREVRSWLGLRAGTPFIAFLGTLEPRKNIPGLIRAYIASCSSLPTPPTLVLAGGARLGLRDRRRSGGDAGESACDSAWVRARQPAARAARWGGDRRLSQLRRGLRPAGSRGDGLWGRRPDDRSTFPARSGG